MSRTIQAVLDAKPDGQILAFFLAAPRRSFGLRELSARLKLRRLPVGLEHLVRAGLVRSFGKRGKRYFIVSNRHPLLPDLEQAAGVKRLRYRDELFDAVRRVGGLRAAYLSGIFTGQPQLPVDLLLVGKPSLVRLSKFLKQLEKLMGQEINYSVMTEGEFQLRRDTFDKFIKDIFDYRHVVVFNTLKEKKPKAPVKEF